MKRFFAIALMLSASCYSVMACDVCGCSSSSQGLGLLPQLGKHFIGVQYQYQTFNSRQVSLLEYGSYEYSTQQFQTAQLWGRYSLGKRVQLFGFVPYVYNTHTNASGTFHSSGIGDVSALANIVLVNSADTVKVRHQLQAGGGVKAPTGAYTGLLQLQKEGLPRTQPGTGSWDFIVNANYTMRKDNTGINVDASYTLTTANKDEYKFGNKLVSQLVAFHSWQLGDILLIPQAGGRYEFSLHDYDNYSRKWLNEDTGGSIVFGVAGVQAYYKRVGVRLAYSLPLYHQYAAGNVKVTQRTDVGLFMLF